MANGSVVIAYELPISGNGKIALHIDAPLSLDDKDRAFILAVLGKVGEFAQIASPAAAKPEIPAMLRGVGGRP